MAQFLLLLLFSIILSNSFLGLAMDSEKPQIKDQSFSEPPSNSNPPTYSLEPSSGRKLGKHQQKHFIITSESPSPSQSYQRNSVEPHSDEVLGGSQDGVHLLKQHHKSFDKSIAGGGVILGGLATTFLVSVFCYIRATRRQKTESNV